MSENNEKPLSAHYYMHKGRYNLLSSDEQWSLVVRGSNGKTISECFDDGSQPDIDGLPPSEVVELISARVEDYLFSSDRDKQRAVIAWFREHADEIDAEWARVEIARLEARIERLRAFVKSAAAEA